ncbi:MAG: GAF domain-containing protein, partial [Bdellovibrionales bacterium]|nr:GAF domain-containing protein [Bdellovibrionales bacterium]
EFGEELRYTRFGSDEQRWLLLKATPLFDENEEFIGWEGFGIDITERRLVEIQLRAQRSRTEALYEVSRALRVNLDPALVTLKGLNALIRATGSDAGFCCFYDPSTKALEMVAAEGLSQTYLDGISGVVEGGASLVRYAVEKRKGVLLENVQNDPRAARDLNRREDLKSAIVMPLVFGRRVLGAMVVFSREAKRYGREDFQLVAAAASQISFAARQAEYYSLEKKEADTLGILYRLTSDISRLFSAREIGEHVFSLLQQDFACRRLWFGVVNNQGTHIVGQAGFGPGIRQQLREIQIELGLRHDFLDEAVRSKRPVVVPAGSQFECSGLNRFLHRMDIGTFVILPMVSLGQVVGVIVAEPVIGSVDYVNKKLPLLGRMVNEVGVVLMARRFEERVAESDKMRVAAVLASGIAHNFNNLLQAVMGQASLIQMQAGEDATVQELAGTIIDAAGKGATLVKQLLNFSAPSSSLKDRISMSRVIQESRELYRSLLGGSISFSLEVPDEMLEVLGDSGLIQQVITNLLINAREAIGSEAAGGHVKVSATRVRLSSGEIDPALPPGNFIRIDVEDNGAGMDEERLSRCFEPFYSSKDQDMSTGISLSGAGLGLSSSYSLVRQHGGVLTARSTPKVGSTFSIF